MTLTTAVIAIFFNTFVNPIALERIGWKYYIVFIVMLIILGLTVYFFYPETRGHTLEQMAVIFDGADAEVPAAAVLVGRSQSVVEEKRRVIVESDREERVRSGYGDETAIQPFLTLIDMLACYRLKPGRFTICHAVFFSCSSSPAQVKYENIESGIGDTSTAPARSPMGSLWMAIVRPRGQHP